MEKMEKLPMEIIEVILSYLPSFIVTKISRTCTIFYLILSNFIKKSEYITYESIDKVVRTAIYNASVVLNCPLLFIKISSNSYYYPVTTIELDIVLVKYAMRIRAFGGFINNTNCVKYNKFSEYFSYKMPVRRKNDNLLIESYLESTIKKYPMNMILYTMFHTCWPNWWGIEPFIKNYNCELVRDNLSIEDLSIGNVYKFIIVYKYAYPNKQYDIKK